MENREIQKIHVGQMLTDFHKGEKILTTKIGRAMGFEGSTISYHHRRAELSTTVILKYSMYHKHNFFLDIAAKLPKDFTTNAPKAEEELAIIMALQKELEEVKKELSDIKDDFKIVKAERDLLKEIIKK